MQTSANLVEQLRAAGHAAVISGAGPSVLVLAQAETTAAVKEFEQADFSAEVLTVPASGAEVH
jgi:homoserine kinase